MVAGRKLWVTPKLEVFGSVQDLTQQVVVGEKYSGGNDGLTIANCPAGCSSGS